MRIFQYTVSYTACKYCNVLFVQLGLQTIYKFVNGEIADGTIDAWQQVGSMNIGKYCHGHALCGGTWECKSLKMSV